MRTPAQDDADYGDGAHLSMRVSVHVSARTTAEITTYPQEGRATIEFSGYRGATGVMLFVRAPELQELRDLLSDTLTALAPDADTTATTDTTATADVSAEGTNRLTDRAA